MREACLVQALDATLQNFSNGDGLVYGAAHGFERDRVKVTFLRHCAS